MKDIIAKKKLELLAPAKNADIGIEAIKHGADAVYIGASKFGARSAAGNSVEDIIRLTNFAHQFNAKVYVTVNTILYDSELKDAENLIRELYIGGVDALIVQDMGILRLNLPPISLHSSTQTDIRIPQKAQFLENVGFSQLVLARELSFEEIKTISSSTTVPLEVFVHGALCVSYSGKCHISEAVMHRSANRGECSQMCRMTYDLVDETGKVYQQNKHLLSLKDFNMSDKLQNLIDAGASSFKIEGRLKDASYVKNVVAYYSEALDKIIDSNPYKYERSSCGKVDLTFTPSLEKSFNRSFTSYFTTGHTFGGNSQMASFLTPKSMGEYIGKVSYVRNNSVRLSTNATISNGDGLSFFNQEEYDGFRVNKVDGRDIKASRELNLKIGDKIYRTCDKYFEDILGKESAKRTISTVIDLAYCGNILSLEINDERGNRIIATNDCDLDKSKSEQSERQASVLGKLGNTIYRVESISTLGDYFIPASVLADLKRKGIELLDKAQNSIYKFDYRKSEDLKAPYPLGQLNYSENVSNAKSKEFYHDHGVSEIENALEIQSNPDNKERVLMNTRYCLRRELGCCLKEENRNNLPEPLYLKNGVVKLKIEFDCKNCEMKLHKV